MSTSIRNSIPESTGTAVLFGGRSWIGYSLSRRLADAGWQVLCTTTVEPSFCGPHETGSIKYVKTPAPEETGKFLDGLKPELVVNLLIGITERDFLFHKSMSQAAKKTGAYYVYFSSALALDAYTNVELVESLPANSVSDYGRFKGRCEKYLQSISGTKSLIVRFSSIHGWNPWKDSRTESFLKRVSQGEQVIVHRGVVQNRMTDNFLAHTITHLISEQKTGTAHIGTKDCSEEVDFLAKLADAFGHDRGLVLPGESRNINLAVIPELGKHPEGDKYEADTINALLGYGQLSKYLYENIAR